MYVVGPELPAVFGNSAPKGNYADMRTDGWEASISWRDNFKLGGKDFSYNLKFAIWDNVTKVTKYMATTNTLPTNYATNYYEGMTLGELWGYTCNGLFQSNEEAQTYADYSKFAQNKIVWQKGDPKYEDLNGDGRIDNGSNRLEDHGDLSIIGNTSPRYCYSLAAGARWNGIGLSMVLLVVGKPFMLSENVSLTAPMLIKPCLFISALIFTFLLNILSAGIPAWRTTRQPIVEALKGNE